jgi:hypothetical protein
MRHYLSASVAAIAVAACSTAAFAQETTSSIRGVVTSGGSPVSGANVTVTHVPSGTTSTVSTGNDGVFVASGLRIGGPFTVKVEAPGYSGSSVTDIALTAGQPLRLPIDLESSGGDIIVSASQTKATELSSGPITAINREAIEGVATVSRDIRDIARRSPFASLDATNSRGLEIAGQNARLNKLSIDGVRFSDNFGLNNGGLPTARGPVPLDAIGELSVKVAPYDVSEGDFQGGAINVVLRSGENDFTGSGFYAYTDDGLTGSKSKDRVFNTPLKSKNYGAFLSGPIIKDKLFFAFAYEKLNETIPAPIGLAGFANVVPNLTQAQIDSVSSIAKSRYNYDTLGTYGSNKETDEKYSAKIDWNVTDGQRASFTYIHAKNVIGTQANSSASTSTPTLGLLSDGYVRPETVDAGIFQLNSEWSDSFSTEARGNYHEYDLVPTAYGATTLGQYSVCLDQTSTPAAPSSCTSSVPRVFFGPDQFRHANSVHSKSYGGDLTAKLRAGNHTFKATASYNFFQVKNVFIPNALGTYYFDSLADFQAGKAGSLTLNGSITGNLADASANYGYSSYMIGIQDSWDITPRLNVTYGSRIDLYGSSSLPPLNVNFLTNYGFSNRGTINGKYVYQPRLGATWTPADRLTIRAGTGIFAGGSPDILLSNSFSASGVFANSITIQRLAGGTCNVAAALCAAALDGVTGGAINPAVINYLQTNTGAISVAAVNAQTRNYKLASSWKSSLSADYKADFGGFLGDHWNFGADVYYSKVNYAPNYTDLRAVRIGTMPDGRPRYGVNPAYTAGGLNGAVNNDYLLFNTRKGHSLIGVIRFEKRIGRDLDIGASYTRSEVKDVDPINGTTSSGSYGQQAMVDPNVGTFGTSVYQIKNNFKFNIDYDHAFFGNYKTRISLFGERRSGRPYSLTMNDPALVNTRSIFGTSGAANRYLLYVPTLNDPLIANTTAADATTLAALNAFIDANGLGKYRGAIMKKNSQQAPSFFKIDLHVDQEIPTFVGTSRIKLFADMENVLNFINKDWGSLRQVDFVGGSLANIVNVSCATLVGNNCTQYRYSSFQNPNLVYQTKISVWSLRVGAKFEF